MTISLHIENVDAGYGAVRALHGVSITVGNAETVALLLVAGIMIAWLGLVAYGMFGLKLRDSEALTIASGVVVGAMCAGWIIRWLLDRWRWTVLVFGTDEGSVGQLPSQSTWMDADLWVRELGIDPMTVIRKMTSDAARARRTCNTRGSHEWPALVARARGLLLRGPEGQAPHHSR